MRESFFIIFMLLPFISEASFLLEHEKGWHWYEEQNFYEVKKKETQHSYALTASEKIEHLKALSKESLNKALLMPSEENLTRYITLQNKLVNLASQFSSNWQKILWKNPSLNYAIDYPTSSIGKEIYHQKEKKSIKNTLEKHSKRYGLFFYFASHCAYCKALSPTVREFVDFYKFDVIAISLDGKVLPEFKQAKKDNGSSIKLEVDVVPALFLIDKHTKAIIPIGYGVMDYQELESRIAIKIKENEETVE